MRVLELLHERSTRNPCSKEPIATKPSEAALHKPSETYDLECPLSALTIAVPAVLVQTDGARRPCDFRD
jgi:hypothetical protein